MMPRAKTRIFLVIAAAAALAAAGACVFLFVQIKEKNERVSALHNEIELAAREEQVLAGQKTLLRDTAKLREELRRYFVSPDGAVAFFELLESVGARAGVTVSIESVEAEARAETSRVEELTLVLSAVGRWEDTLRFLGLLELMPLRLSIVQTALARVEGAHASLWRADLSLRVLKLRS
ncbi:MAG: hypothetical protein AAB699_00015 [Patescibacteria group bacterium]